MSNEKYNDQLMTQYLLDSLPADKAEYFDELSFTDDEFAAQLNAVEKDLIDAFIHGELAGENLERFNSYYLASPLRREKVEFAKAFQVYAKREMKSEEIPKTEQSKSGFFSAVVNFINGNKLQLGFAVGLLFLILSGLWVFSNRGKPPEIEIVTQKTPTPVETSAKPENTNVEKEMANINQNVSSTPKPENKNVNTPENRINPTPVPTPSIAPKPVIASFILAPPLRGGTSLQTFSIPKETDSITVQLQLEADDYSAYQVSLIDQSNKNLWRSGKLKSVGKGENKSLNLRFSAKLLRSNIYSLVVSGIKPDGEVEIISNYSFRSVLK